MSGGSWNYAYGPLETLADRLQSDRDVQRRALGAVMAAMAKAMYAIEWVDSGDYAYGDDRDAIAAVFAAATGAELREAIRSADAARGDLERILAEARK